MIARFKIRKIKEDMPKIKMKMIKLKIKEKIW
jgi:hypothetical protein